MSKPAQNILTIRPIEGGLFFLSGRINGRQIRMKHTKVETLERKKADLEAEHSEAIALAGTKPVPQYTTLTPQQLKLAQALFTTFANDPRPIMEYALAGRAVLGSAQLMPIANARTLWEQYMTEEERLSQKVIDRNIGTLDKFVADAAPVHVSDITNESIEKFCSLTQIKARTDGPASMYSKITRASCIRAFLNFCVAKKMILRSPFEMNMKKLHELAKKQQDRAAILTPAQSIALMNAAIESEQRMIPFLIFSVWCFARVEEVKRMTPADVKHDRGTPFIEPISGKVRTPSYRTTEIPANMLPLLKDCIKAGLMPAGEEIFFEDKAFRRVREKAGLITYHPKDEHGNRRIKSSVWEQSIMRHTGISMLYQQYTEQARLGKFTKESVIAAVTQQAGNSEDVAFSHYINIPNASDAAEFFAYTPRLKMVAQQIAQRVA